MKTSRFGITRRTGNIRLQVVINFSWRGEPRGRILAQERLVNGGKSFGNCGCEFFFGGVFYEALPTKYNICCRQLSSVGELWAMWSIGNRPFMLYSCVAARRQVGCCHAGFITTDVVIQDETGSVVAMQEVMGTIVGGKEAMASKDGLVFAKDNWFSMVRVECDYAGCAKSKFRFSLYSKSCFIFEYLFDA
ncbi:hypothetical protein Adt_09788 [Abeliophyllum distichum]|uniref:Uncharacterized protein n=1 Tax=Abeliophyllum distichum TaxID=126358 RepID=A0ABD1UI64_9LAMI